jgi:RNA polymerase sigma factor (sigma-70 family)
MLRSRAVADELSDDALLAAWRAGDRAAGGRLFDRYYQPVARFFANKLEGASEELIQRTFLACVEGLPKFLGKGSFRSYLFSIAYRQLCRHHRTRRGEPIDFGTVSAHDLGPTPSQVLAERDEQRLMLVALRRIPIDCQVALELLYWERMGTAEIAAVLDVPEGTIKSRLRRGRELLRAAIEGLAASPELAQSTLEDVDAWAQALRERVARERAKKDPPLE